MEEERKIKEEKDSMIKRRKELIRLISVLCEEKLPESKYDKFFVEEFSKKVKRNEELEQIYTEM